MALNSPDAASIVTSPGPRFSPPTRDWERDDSGTFALLEAWRVVRRQSRFMAGFALAFGLATAVVVLARHRTYTATVSFLLQAPKTPFAVPGIAAQLGLNLPAADPGQSPAFYAELIRSRAILSALADTTFTFKTNRGATTTASLADAYDVRQQAAPLRRDALISDLDDHIAVRTSLKSGVITFAVAAPAPDLARQMASTLVDELNRFNTQRRQSQAAAERRFTERRLQEVGTELRNAEQAMEDFLSRNRVMSGSPQLKFQNDRLSRAVELYRGLYSNMAQSYEQAKIDEVRDTPQITVIQVPETPARADSRLLVGKTLAAAVFGALLGLVVGFVRLRMRDIAALSAKERIATDSM